MNNSTHDPYVTSFPFSDFAPTLTQCYVIIAIGYLVARFQLLSSADQRGALAFVTYLGMPGIICMTLADADFSSFRWELLLSMFLGKALLFLLVSAVATWVTRNAGVAGVLAVFCVHCNDLPVGNPLISSIYRDQRPQMIKYLFLMPAMTALVFVPLGHFLVGFHKSRPKDSHQGSLRLATDAALAITWKAVPVLGATVLGLVLNYLFGRRMSEIFHKPLQALADTIPGMVLALIGFSFVRKERYLLTSAVVPACLLLLVKMFLTPVLLHTLTNLMTDDSEGSRKLSDFSLLYGVVSPATAIFTTGHEFRTSLAAMSAALIVSSLLSFPAGYMVAKYTVPTNRDFDEHMPLLKTAMFWIACLSLLCDIYVWVSILWKKKGLEFPHCYVLCLSLTQMMACCGVIPFSLGVLETDIVYIKTVLYYGGEISGYIWTATAAVLMLTSKEYRFLSIAIATFGACVGLVLIMCAFVAYHDAKTIHIAGTPQTDVQYIQLMMSTLILAACFVIAALCLLLYFKRVSQGDQTGQDQSTNRFGDYNNPIFFVDEDISMVRYNMKRGSNTWSIKETLNGKSEEEAYYKEINPQGHFSKEENGHQRSLPFFSLVLLLFLTMFVKLVLKLYRVTRSDAKEIVMPLEFFVSALFIGQGVFSFLTFGINARNISIKFTKWWRRCCYGQDDVRVDSYKNQEIASFCSRFSNFYFDKCFRQIAKDRKWVEQLYPDCFWGHQLVDWMIEEGVAHDDVEAEELGQRLLLGGVIRHVENSHHFHDAPYLYSFVTRT